MTVEANKALIKSILNGFTAGRPEIYLNSLADDFVLEVKGKHPYAGRWDRNGAPEVLESMSDGLDGNLTLQVERMVAEGEYVVTQVTGSARTKSGKPYEQSYCQVWRVVDGRLAGLTEYVDGQAIAEAFGQ